MALVIDRAGNQVIQRNGDLVTDRAGYTPPEPPPSGDRAVTLLNPALLKPSLTDGAGNLRHALVTDSYSGGTPSAASELRGSLVDDGGKLKPGLCLPHGTLKPSLLK